MLLTCLIATTIFALIFMLYFRKKNSEAKLQINFIDYKNINFYNEITVKLKNNIIYRGEIKERSLIINLFSFGKKMISQGQIIIRNSAQKLEKSFKISLYKNYTNDINIKINYTNSKYYYSEIIFYGEDLEKIIESNDFNYNTFNLKKRIRLVICNIGEKELIEIIEKNNRKKSFNADIERVINQSPKENLLINIFIGEKNSNILIFKEENENLKVPNKDERRLFEDFYNHISINKKIYSQCSLFKRKIYEKNTLFGTSMIDKTDKEKNEIYISFLNQGMNCLLENDIITKKDKNFMLGYLIFLIYLCDDRKFDKQKINEIHFLIREMASNGFDEIEQIKMVIAYIIFSLNYSYRFIIIFTDHLMENNSYIEGFNFYEKVIKELNEESEIMLLYLQLNSGFSSELLNEIQCYKLSMISIQEIKSHLINNIPKYFFVYFEDETDFIISDQRTQILAFNEEQLFRLKGEELSKGNKAMNVVIGTFHESGHQKLHMNIDVGAKLSPMWYITKNYDLKFQIDKKKKKKAGEAGKCVDDYLYGYNINSGFLIKSNNSYKLMKKELFVGNLDLLNNKANEIVKTFVDEYIKDGALELNDNQIDVLENPFKQKKSSGKYEYESIIIDGIEYPCGLDVDSY